MKKSASYSSKLLVITFILPLLFSWSSCRRTKDDPLKNTKQLVVRGHKNLYQNGAFKIPNSEIHLIPAGPSPMEIAMDLVGIRARFAFLLSLKKAAQSVQIVSEGTKLSFRAAGNLHHSTAMLAQKIRSASRKDGLLLIYKNSKKGQQIIGDSWKFSKKLIREMDEVGDSIIASSWRTGDRVRARLIKDGLLILKNSKAASQRILKRSTKRSTERMNYGYNEFIVGYATLPSNLKQNASQVGDALKEANIVKIVKKHNVWRKKVSGMSVNLITSSAKNYTSDIKQSFSRAKRDISNYKTTGVSLATLKALRWVLKGILWDAIIKPVAKTVFGGFGYIAVNGVAFPVMVALHEGKAITEIAVATTWNLAKSTYQIIAPSGTIAVASIWSLLDVSINATASGAVRGGGFVAGHGSIRRGKIASVIIKGSGYAAAKTIQYVGVPMAAAGIMIAGGTIGTAYAVAGALPGATMIVAGETAAVTTRLFGVVLSGAVMATGPVLSLGVGGGHAVYRLAKAVVVPSTYTLGAGIVLSYGTMSHLAAHTILAAADAAYLVLSLEGPRWVVYAVSGKLGKGRKLVPGTVLNLKKMQKSGEVIKYIPVSKKEMQKVVGSSYKNLPVKKKKSVKDHLTRKEPTVKK
jgi:hypothetical protein